MRKSSDQNPRATVERKRADYADIISATNGTNPIFCLHMGMKIKDSLLQKYASGSRFTKKVTYILLINMDKLSEFERGLLLEKISGYIPTGLNDKKYSYFSEIAFDLTDITQLKRYGIGCTVKD